MPRISDDGALEAALYGTSHMRTKLSVSDCRRLEAALSESMAADLAAADAAEAERILTEEPGLVYSDGPLPEGLPGETAEAAARLRSYARSLTALRLVQQWERGIEARGRLVGLAEHSARTSCSEGPDLYDSAVSRFGGGVRCWKPRRTAEGTSTSTWSPASTATGRSSGATSPRWTPRPPTCGSSR
ncbi:hypothetical protein [Candidatus Methanomethylophilus sp. 1R26]|uniref:hypothetical protein n=1 Tax=Candidatus Methanomethylophilus sp. 1R26 TaxID=1769296 RepID=UPI0012FEBC04|nr:hypothetical protein [Candidatus Methanomethylophilus sp. 1R26]